MSDLIKGIRAHSKESPESLLEFLNDAVNECRDELNTTDLEVKATAILKLTYLEMYGFDMSWCNFHILEVMSSSKFQQKRIGYLAAIQSLKSEPELLILATNQFKKDLNSHNHVEVGLALSGIATIVSPALAKDILNDVTMKLSHSKPYIRKKAVLALFKVFLQYPESLRSTLPRVIEKLDDTDVAVVSATITIICEISKKNPNIFVSYLPKFFAILEDTSNNWLIIRILKLFLSLLRIEPRMKKRTLPSILGLLGKTEATSLVYECINCIVNGGMISGGSSKDKDVAKLCIDHLMKFFDTRDSNLKFVGLLALIKILEIFPAFIHKNADVSSIIMQCLTDGDMIIKRKALEICHYLATEDNMALLVKTLLLQLVPDTSNGIIEDGLKLDITKKILQIASADNYANIPNFKWYITALKELVNLTLLTDTNKFTKSSAPALPRRILNTIAIMIGREFQSVTTRVPSIRPFVINKVVIEYASKPMPLEACPLLMRDIYWIMGEYVHDFGVTDNDGAEDQDVAIALGQKVSIFNNIVNVYVDKHLNLGTHFLVSTKLIHLREPRVITIVIDALIKLLSGILADYKTMYTKDDKIPFEKVCEIGYFLTKLISYLEHWQQDSSFEVQERCLSWLEYLKLCLDALDLGDGIDKIQTEELLYYTDKFLSASSESADQNSEDEAGSESADDSGDSDDSDDSDDSSDDNITDTCEDVDQTDEEQHSKELTEPSNQAPRHLPAILSEVLPSFFQSYQLNPISVTAQSHIALPDDIDLDLQIEPVPNFCFETSPNVSEDESSTEQEEDDESRGNTPDITAQRERSERLKDDPYYISGSSKKKSGKSKQKLLNLDDESSRAESMSPSDIGSFSYLTPVPTKSSTKTKKVKKEKVVILLEETLGETSGSPQPEPVEEKKKKKKSNLIIDSFGLENLDLNAPEDKVVEKDYEYDIDLTAMRQNLEKKAKKASKTKKKKSEASLGTGSAKKSKKVVLPEIDANPSEIVPDTAAKSKEPSQEATRETSAEPLVNVEPVLVASKEKTKKKKKKAVIAD